MTETILYYPTIKVTDSPWLRNAILYWDNIATIVPSIYKEDYYTPEMGLLEETNMYKSVSPTIIENNLQIYPRISQIWIFNNSN